MKILTAAFLLFLSIGAAAQQHRDPLNPREVDQMRDSAQDPKKRVELLIAFSKERMLSIDRLRASANKPGADDSWKIADLLADIATLIDELDDNLAMYNGHSEDLRRPLHHVVDVEAEMLQKLAALGESASPQQKRRFAAALEDATDSLKSSSESAHAMLAEEVQKKGEDKSKENAGRQGKATDTYGAEHQPPPDHTGMGGTGRKPE